MSQNKNFDINILNLKTNLIKQEIDNEKLRNERFAYILNVFNQFIWAIQGIQLKSFFKLYSSIYDINSFIFWRHLTMTIIGYSSIKYKKIQYKLPKNIHYKCWFYIRNIGIYICIYTWMVSLSIFRLSTCQIFSGLTPFLTILFSIIFLKDKFHKIYVFGIIICFIGSTIIFSNERTPNNNNINKKKSIGDLFIGIISLMINVNLFSLGNVGQKFLCNENLTAEEQSLYFGFYSVIISGIFCIFNFNFGLSNIKYCLYCMSNGIIFYLCYYLNSVSFKYIEISKLMIITYLSVVLIVFFGSYLFNENLYFTDLIGASLIIGFIIYNGYHPPKD